MTATYDFQVNVMYCGMKIVGSHIGHRSLSPSQWWERSLCNWFQIKIKITQWKVILKSKSKSQPKHWFQIKITFLSGKSKSKSRSQFLQNSHCFPRFVYKFHFASVSERGWGGEGVVVYTFACPKVLVFLTNQQPLPLIIAYCTTLTAKSEFSSISFSNWFKSDFKWLKSDFKIKITWNLILNQNQDLRQTNDLKSDHKIT